jgi:aldehyde:ferredoxin oxidoreductase
MTNDETVTLNDVIQAWQVQLDACDRWEYLVMRGADEDLCERAWEEMIAATTHAENIQEMYDEQYRCRQWLENGRWVVEVA